MQIAIVILLSIIAFLLLILVWSNEKARDLFKNTCHEIYALSIFFGIALAVLAGAIFGIKYLFF